MRKLLRIELLFPSDVHEFVKVPSSLALIYIPESSSSGV